MNKIFQKEFPRILTITTILSFIFFLIGINSWKFLYVDDEWAAFLFAKHIVDINFLINPFSMNGVYGENPVLGSLYQAIFLKFLGISNFSWRFSNIVLIIPLSIFFYFWIKELAKKEVALIATILLQFSFYLANFFKIGYINPQALLLFIISLYYATITGKYRKYLHGILLGVTLGISFYIYIGPLFPFFIWPFLIPIFKKRGHLKHKLLLLLSIGLPYILIISPGLLQTSHLDIISKKTVFQKEFTDNRQILINILRNFLLFFKNYDYLYNHFVIGPYLDVITRIFSAIGIVLILLKKRNSPLIFFVLSYVSTAIFIGLISPYSYTPTTRGMFFLPYGFVFAGIALWNVLLKRGYYFLTTLLIVCIIFLNIYQSQFGVFNQIGHPTTSLIFRYVKYDTKSDVVVISSYSYPYTNHNLPTLLSAYNISNSIQIIESSQIYCPLLEGKKIILNTQDAYTKNRIDSLPCSHNIDTIEINPTMPQ